VTTTKNSETLGVGDGIGLVEALLGLPGFRVLAVIEAPVELVIEIETTADRVGCPGCGVRAEAQDRMPVEIRDRLRAAGPAGVAQAPLALSGGVVRDKDVDRDVRARLGAGRADPAGGDGGMPPGGSQRPPGGRARRGAGVCWWTIMAADDERGRPLVEDPDLVGEVRALGVDETSFLRAARDHPTIYATGLVDLDERILIDMVEGDSAGDLRRWLDVQPSGWLEGIGVVATDLAESYRAGLAGRLDHATRVADPSHVVRVPNRCLDTVRRRVQNETLGHRGRQHDPLYRIRKIMLAGAERVDERGHERMLLGLRIGDPHDEVLGAWLAKESGRDPYLTDEAATVATLLDKTITGWGWHERSMAPRPSRRALSPSRGWRPSPNSGSWRRVGPHRQARTASRRAGLHRHAWQDHRDRHHR
jgi:transposase